MRRGLPGLYGIVLYVLGGITLCVYPCAAVAGPPSANLDKVVSGNTEFALDLYGKLRSGEGNLFLSPHSVSTALAMTYAGARGATGTEMAHVLHFLLKLDQLHPAFAELESSLRLDGQDPHVALHTANGLWGQQGYGFLQEFRDLCAAHYGAGFREVDFAQAPDSVRRRINTWVARQTHEKIQELLRPGDITADTALVLTNAIYFKGAWASQFDSARTAEGAFKLDAERQVTVPMMKQLGKFPFATYEQVNVLELPYAGDRLSMVLILPKEVNGLRAVEQTLTGANLERWLAGLNEQPVRVSMPRFELDYRADLTQTLQALGMAEAFAPGRADFSGMTGRSGLFISMVIHQAQLVVHEQGTQASAATAVVKKGISLLSEFVVDHPFIFLIRDRQTGSILFLGRVLNPTG
ncbi:MAG: serpin family protein [Planctomycetota bacterium]